MADCVITISSEELPRGSFPQHPREVFYLMKTLITCDVPGQSTFIKTESNDYDRTMGIIRLLLGLLSSLMAIGESCFNLFFLSSLAGVSGRPEIQG